MLGTQNSVLEGRSALAGLLAANGALESADSGMDGEFAATLGEPLRELLVGLGADPNALQGMNAKQLLAQLKSLVAGQADAASGNLFPRFTTTLGTLQGDLESLQEDLGQLQTGLGQLENGLERLQGNVGSEGGMSLAALRAFLQGRVEDPDNGEGGAGGEGENPRTTLVNFLQPWLQGPNNEADAGAEGAEGGDLTVNSLTANSLTLNEKLRRSLDRMESGYERVSGRLSEGDQQLLAGVRKLLIGVHQDAKEGAGEEEASVLARLRDLVSGESGQNADSEESQALLARLRSLVGGESGQGTDSEENQALLARLRTLLTEKQDGLAGVLSEDGAGTDENGALLAGLRRLLGEERSDGAAEDEQARRPLFDLVSRAVSERGGNEFGTRSSAELAETDALTSLKNWVATQRGGEQNRVGGEGSPAFDLARLITPEGARQLAERLASMARVRENVAEFKLNPPSLGSMEVRVAMEADKAHVHFVVPNAAARDLLEAAMPRLREALAQDGLSLGDASVSDQPPQSRDQAAEQGTGTGAGGGESDEVSTALAGDEEVEASAESRRRGTLAALARKLDLFA
jgi:flagellar hook-length control protein FliK